MPVVKILNTVEHHDDNTQRYADYERQVKCFAASGVCLKDDFVQTLAPTGVRVACVICHSYTKDIKYNELVKL